MPTRPSHPSGRPIRREKIGVRSIWRVPDEGPVTPGLRKQAGSYAVGFTHDFSEIDQANDGSWMKAKGTRS